MGVTVRGAPDGEDYRFASAIGVVGVIQNAGAAQCRSAPGMAVQMGLLTCFSDCLCGSCSSDPLLRMSQVC